MSEDFRDINYRTLEHKTAKISGGLNDLSNLVLACKHCNCVKNRRNLDEFRLVMFKKSNNIPLFTNDVNEWLINNINEYKELLSNYKKYKYYFEEVGYDK